MPWGCWVELKDKDVHCKEWKCIIENFAEEEADTTAHQIYGQCATLSVNYKLGDWDSVWAWILKAGSGWRQKVTAEGPQNMNKLPTGSLGAVTAHHIKWILSGRSAVKQMQQWQHSWQAEQIMDAGPKRVSLLSAFQITETAIPSYQRRPSSLEWGKKTSRSFNESARGLSLRETNVWVSTKDTLHNGQDAVKTLRTIILVQTCLY